MGSFGNLRLVVMRAAGGDSYTAVRSGPSTSIPTAAGHALVTTPVNPGLPISQGDYVGVDVLDSTSSLAARTTADSRFTYRFWSPFLADGTTLPGTPHTGIRESLYQVTIDPNPAGLTGQRAAALKKCKHKHSKKKRKKCRKRANRLPL